MSRTAIDDAATQREIEDGEVVIRVLAGETAMFEIIMRRHNQRLHRISQAILRDDSLAEDAVQNTYLRAYEHLGQFAGRAKFSTWLVRIAIHEALAQKRRSSRYHGLERTFEEEGDRMDSIACRRPNPEQLASGAEMHTLLDHAIDLLPVPYRAVFVLRKVEDMSTIEVARALEISEENVKTRLDRARSRLRKRLFSEARTKRKETFHFIQCSLNTYSPNKYGVPNWDSVGDHAPS